MANLLMTLMDKWTYRSSESAEARAKATGHAGAVMGAMGA